MKGALRAEEHIYITLFHLPEAPIGNAPFHQRAIHQLWTAYKGAEQLRNAAEQHGICIDGVGTMKWLYSRGEFFYNKYLEKKDHVIMDCTEKRIVAKNKLEYAKDCSTRNTGFA